MRRAVGGVAPEAVPIFDPTTRDTWLARRAAADRRCDAPGSRRASTTVEADAALRELVAITCRWLAVLGLSQRRCRRQRPRGPRARARAWSAATTARRGSGSPAWRPVRRRRCPGLDVALAGATALEALADRLDDRDRRRTAAALATRRRGGGRCARAARAVARVPARRRARRRGGELAGRAAPRSRARRRVGRAAARRRGRAARRHRRHGRRAAVAARSRSSRRCRRRSPSCSCCGAAGAARRGSSRRRGASSATTTPRRSGSPRCRPRTPTRSPMPPAIARRTPASPRTAPPTPSASSAASARSRALANRLVRAPLIAVLGPSGAGKSSFIHAGVLPRLAEHYRDHHDASGAPPDARARRAAAGRRPTPDDQPRSRRRLRELGERAPRGAGDRDRSARGARHAVQRCRRAHAVRRDRSPPPPTARRAPVRVVVTLRDDFATVIESEAALRGRFEVFVLAHAAARGAAADRHRAGAPRGGHGRAARRRRHGRRGRRPAGVAAAAVVHRVAAVGRRAIATARRITHDAYLAIGGVAGALVDLRRQVYDSPRAPRPGHRARSVRAPRRRRRHADPGAARRARAAARARAAVLAHLIDARLLVVREDDGRDVVEIVHECLAERWPRLARWRSEDAADRALLGDVARGGAALAGGEPARRSAVARRGARGAAPARGALDRADRRRARVRRRGRARRARARGGCGAGSSAARWSRSPRSPVVMAYLGVAREPQPREAEESAVAASRAAQLAEDRLTAEPRSRRAAASSTMAARIAALAYFGEALRRGADGTGAPLHDRDRERARGRTRSTSGARPA